MHHDGQHPEVEPAKPLVEEVDEFSEEAISNFLDFFECLAEMEAEREGRETVKLTH